MQERNASASVSLHVLECICTFLSLQSLAGGRALAASRRAKATAKRTEVAIYEAQADRESVYFHLTPACSSVGTI